MSRLDFSVSDLNLSAIRDKTRRASISGEARARYLFRFHDRLKAIAQ